MKIEKFNPTMAEIQQAIEDVKDLTVKDETSYEIVKEAKKKIADYRIAITKFGKEQRQEALNWQREVLRQEKELIAMIEPTETRFKNELSEFDEAKKREERKILLPSRKKMLEELQDLIPIISDDEIVAMDEKEFSEFYTAKKMEHTEIKEKAEREAKEKKEREEELEKAKKEAKLKERERLAGVEARRKEREKEEADEKARKEKEEKEKLEKDKVFQAFLKNNGYNKDTDILQQDENEIRLYRIVNTLKK